VRAFAHALMPSAVWPGWSVALVPLAALGLAASGVVTHASSAWFLALGALAGLPHGALDALAVQRLLRPRFGRMWTLPFVSGYLGFGAIVVGGWLVTPMAALALLLVVGAWHFGTEMVRVGAKDRALRVWVLGLAPIVAPALLWPLAMQNAFAPLVGGGAARVALALAGPVALVWSAAAIAMLARPGPGHVELIATLVIFVALPPLPAFAVYFAGLHGPRALGAIARTERRPLGALWAEAMPWALAGGTMLIIGFLLLRPSMPEADALDRAVFIGLSSLAAPHIALGAWLNGEFGRRRPA